MPILNGRHVSLADWRASQAAPAVVNEEPAEEPAAIVERPKRRSPSRREREVKAALGIVEEPVAPETPEATGEPTDEVEAATQSEEDSES